MLQNIKKLSTIAIHLDFQLHPEYRDIFETNYRANVF